MRPSTGRNVCIIFVKWPEQGSVKTRLASGSNTAFATAFYKLCCEHIVRTLASCDEYATTIAYSPTSAEGAIRDWLGTISNDLTYTPQSNDPNLGERMGGCIRECLSQEAGKVVLVGSDIPDIDQTVVQRAFSTLGSAEVVFGPAEDGGFYLVGGCSMPEGVMQGIEWSTSTVLAASLQNCARLHLKADSATLPTLQDIDTMQELYKWLESGDTSPLKKAIREVLHNTLPKRHT